MNNNLEQINFDISTYTELFDNYKQDLLSYIEAAQEADSYIKVYLLNRLVAKWKPELGFDTSKILNDIGELQTPKTQQVALSLSLKQVLDYYKTTSNKWIVPNLLRKCGLYILAGEPKAGKSLLIYFLMYALATGSEFLGRSVKLGKVLYIQLEENLDTIGERFTFTGFGNMSDETNSLVVNFTNNIWIERRFDIINDLGWLVKRIEEYEPTLVIIDSLRMASLNSNVSENTSDFGKLVYRLQEVFNHTDCCGLVIHHMNKGGTGVNKKTAGLVDRMSGSTSIAAATSGLIGISSEETESGRLITLRTLPRDGTPLHLQYQIKLEEGGLWKLEKVWEDTPLTNPLTARVLRFLAQHPDELFSIGKLATALDETLNSDFKEVVNYLYSSQIISTKFTSGNKLSYYLPQESMWIVNPQTVQSTLSNTIVDANILMGALSKEELINITLEWSRDRRTEAIEALVPEEYTRLIELSKSYLYEVGEEVYYNDDIYIVQEQLPNPTLYNTKYKLIDVSEPVKELDLVLLDGVSEKEAMELKHENLFD